MNKTILRLSIFASLFSLVLLGGTLSDLFRNNYDDLISMIVTIAYYFLGSVFCIFTLKEYSSRKEKEEKIVRYIQAIKKGDIDTKRKKEDYYENVCDIILNECNKK